MVENAGKPPAGLDDWVTLQQQHAVKSERIFRLFAEQQQVTFDQVVARQTAANQEIWGRVAQPVAA